MRHIEAELIETPDAEKPYKVLVKRRGEIISEQPVPSKKAGQAMILELEKVRREGRFEL